MRNILHGIAVTAILSACGEAPDHAGSPPDIEAGRTIAAADCSDCHGMDGRGATTEIPNLTAQPVQYLVEAMYAYRDGGRLHAALQDMTAGMSDADILNISAYYASLPPLDPEENTPVANAAYMAGATVATLCEECH